MADKSNKAAPKKQVLPSDIAALEHQYRLTRPEAERVAKGESVETVKGERTVNVQVYRQVEAEPAFHPLAAADAAEASR